MITKKSKTWRKQSMSISRLFATNQRTLQLLSKQVQALLRLTIKTLRLFTTEELLMKAWNSLKKLSLILKRLLNSLLRINQWEHFLIKLKKRKRNKTPLRQTCFKKLFRQVFIQRNQLLPRKKCCLPMILQIQKYLWIFKLEKLSMKDSFLNSFQKRFLRLLRISDVYIQVKKEITFITKEISSTELSKDSWLKAEIQLPKMGQEDYLFTEESLMTKMFGFLMTREDSSRWLIQAKTLMGPNSSLLSKTLLIWMESILYLDDWSKDSLPSLQLRTQKQELMIYLRSKLRSLIVDKSLKTFQNLN